MHETYKTLSAGFRILHLLQMSNDPVQKSLCYDTKPYLMMRQRYRNSRE